LVVPPEIFFMWELGGAGEVDSLDDVVGSDYCLYSSPEIEDFEGILFAEFEHC